MAAVKNLLSRIGLLGASHASSVTLAADVLAAFPGPILILGGEGQLVAHNEAAVSLADALDGGGLPAISAITARAIVQARPQADVVVVPGAGGQMLYELSVLPTADGMTMVLAKDVTLESNLRSTLVESRQRYKDLVEISSDFAWEIGSDGSFAFVSPCGALGYSPDELVGRQPADFIVDQPGVDGLLSFRSDTPVADAEVWMRGADGRISCLLASSSPLLDAEGQRRGARGVCRDVTKERERDAALARANNRERLLAYIVRTIRDVVDPADMLNIAAEATARAMGGVGCQIFRHDDRGFTLAAAFGDVGNAATALAGLSHQDSIDGQAENRMFIAAVARYRHTVNGAIIVWRQQGDLRWGEDEYLLLGDVASQIGIANEQIANHERIVTLSRTDALTGLFNRRAFFEELSRRFSRLSRDQKAAALIYVDLDNFKLVNDVHGHKRGDEALLAVRDILLGHTRPIDLIARLGGDEFAVWLEGADQDAAVRRCEAMIKAARTLEQFSGSPDCPLTMSLGVAVHAAERPETFNDLLARADDAMYSVKREGKGSYHLAGPARSGLLLQAP